MIDIDIYLQRIGYEGSQEATLSTLSQIQKAHLLHIPFENLDIHMDVDIILNVERIYNKIILNNRGGFCYELNGLYHALLEQLGFKVDRISGKVYNEKQKVYEPEYDHMALMVEIDNNVYIADVGFGEFVFHPLLFNVDVSQDDERGRFYIDAYDQNYYRINKQVDGRSIPQYIFRTQPRSYSEFEDMSWYHQSCPKSHFTQKQFIGIPTPHGRVTLVGRKLKIIDNGTVKERLIDDQEYSSLLVKYFNFKNFEI